MLQVFFLLLNWQKLLKFFKGSEEVLLRLFIECFMNQRKLECTGAVHALSLTLHLGEGKVRVDNHLEEHVNFVLHGWNFGFEGGNDCLKGLVVKWEEMWLFLRNGCDLLNFYFFILFFIKEGEVQRFIGSVDVVVDEVQIGDHVDEKVWLFFPLKGFG